MEKGLMMQGLKQFRDLKEQIENTRSTPKESNTLYSWVVYLNMCDMMFDVVQKNLVRLHVHDINEKYDNLKKLNPYNSYAAVRAEEIRLIKLDFSKYAALTKSMIKTFEKLDSNPLMKLAAVKLHSQFSEWFILEMEDPNEEKDSTD